ncbi:cytochrome c oxidase assembly protein [Paracoccus aerodenitrificans]|uniref:cytochrome c oxidase assembly protein n=1 Tax=Paracoccus aerodenitrificans TaxID=3017781 RepID=UPI0022F0998D|nr:cytochrome c oxidase assembly protein [Paracoccus aerodenitrificans]WBU63214.1 cytochrome c oxidase assembly protein [Paracoccus aerodenitrificans]
MSILPKDKNSRVVVSLVGVVVVMGALAWAAVPFYNWFCRVTGYAGTTQVADANSAGETKILDEKITIRFDGNTDPSLPWGFKPMQREMEMRIGETGLAFYEAVNNSDRTVTGRASYNVAPDIAGSFFYKIECFCFTEQTLKPGERIEMPVTFEVDPEIVTDRDARKVRDITLSYTFHPFETDEPADDTQAALTTGQDTTRMN